MAWLRRRHAATPCLPDAHASLAARHAAAVFTATLLLRLRAAMPLRHYASAAAY